MRRTDVGVCSVGYERRWLGKLGKRQRAEHLGAGGYIVIAPALGCVAGVHEACEPVVNRDKTALLVVLRCAVNNTRPARSDLFTA